VESTKQDHSYHSGQEEDNDDGINQ
jgi:hypothetical protein